MEGGLEGKWRDEPHLFNFQLLQQVEPYESESEDDDPDKRSAAEKILDGMARPDLDKPK